MIDSENRPCLGAGCARIDGTHADTCYASDFQKNKIAAYWRERTQYYKPLEAFFEARELRTKRHDSHGFYLDAWVGGRQFMIDPSPDDLRSYPPGLVRVRDSTTHHYEHPTFIGDVLMSDDDWERQLEVLLCFGVLAG